MASPELAEKLKKRLDGSEKPEETSSQQEPPPAPVMPQKIVENPYIPCTDTSIDDLIFKALEKKEENNNNQSTKPLQIKTDSEPSTSPIPMNQHQNPTVVDPRSPPPKRSIQELLEMERLENEQQQQAAPVPKTPVMVITKGAFPRSSSPRRQQFVRENEDGNELEKRLAAQRLKKYTEEMEAKKPVDVLDEIMKSPPPPPPPTSPPQLPTSPPPPAPPARIASVRSEESIEEEERRRKEIEDTASFEELEAEIMRISRSPVPPPVLSIPPPPPPNIPLPSIPRVSPSPPSPRPTSVPPPIPSPGPSENVNMDELIESFSDSVIINSVSPPPPLPPLRESSLEAEEVNEKTPEDPTPEIDRKPEKKSPEKQVPTQEKVEEAKPEQPPTEPEPTELPAPIVQVEVPEVSAYAVSDIVPKPLEVIEERPKAPTPIRDSSLPPPPPPKPETPLAIRRATGPIPTPQLIEMIHQEDFARPASPTSSSVSHSRPQSPAVPKKPSVVISPLGLLCDPHLSHEKSTVTTENPEEVKPMDPVPVPPVDETELTEALERRNKIIEGENVPLKMNKKISLYAEFNEFSRKQIQYFVDTFKKYDEDQDNFIDFNELKRMMEKLGEAQTHIALKELIKKVDEDQDGKISQREFLLIFRLAASGELSCSEVFKTLAESVDVSKEGVLGAANFFQAKIEEQTKLSRFEEEMKEEKEEKRRQEEEKKARREKFLASKSIFH